MRGGNMSQLFEAVMDQLIETHGLEKVAAYAMCKLNHEQRMGVAVQVEFFKSLSHIPLPETKREVEGGEQL